MAVKDRPRGGLGSKACGYARFGRRVEFDRRAGARRHCWGSRRARRHGAGRERPVRPPHPLSSFRAESRAAARRPGTQRRRDGGETPVWVRSRQSQKPRSRQLRAHARRWVPGLRCASPGMTIAGRGVGGLAESAAPARASLPPDETDHARHPRHSRQSRRLREWLVVARG